MAPFTALHNDRPAGPVNYFLKLRRYRLAQCSKTAPNWLINILGRQDPLAKKSTRKDGEPIIIKKYANRRLYNTATSAYVTLDNLCEMVKQGEDFVVKDAKSGEDITRSVLTQIIFEEEGKGQNLLPIRFLRQLIGLYGNSLQAFVPSYLEMSMESFAREQENLKDRLSTAFGGRERLGQFEGQIRQNLSMFENALRMFSPFGGVGATAPNAEEAAKPAAPKSGKKTGPKAAPSPASGSAPNPAPSPNEEPADNIDELKRQMDAMQAQLDALAGGQKGAKTGGQKGTKK